MVKIRGSRSLKQPFCRSYSNSEPWQIAEADSRKQSFFWVYSGNGTNNFKCKNDVIPNSKYSQLSRNNFSGTMDALCNLGNLQTLSLSDNNLSGSIPECIGQMTSLMGISLTGNSLTGHLPLSFKNLISLEYL